MMHDREKSDPPIVAVKSANKPANRGAESMERRGGTKGNAFQTRMHPESATRVPAFGTRAASSENKGRREVHGPDVPHG